MKNKLKIKLIHPPDIMNFPVENLLPYGMGVITAILKENGYEVNQDDLFGRVKSFNNNLKLFSNRLINLGIFLFDEKKVKNCLIDGISNPLLNRLAESLLHLTSYKNFDIIGFSVHCYSDFLFALLLAEKIKQEKDVPIVFGGPFVTLHGNLYFERYKFIDYMIVGDGGIPFLKLLSFLEGDGRIKDIPNLFYRENGMVKVNPREYFDIEEIPLPDFEGLPLDSYKTDYFKEKLFLTYQISRECSFRCSFCTFYKVDVNPSIKSPEKVIKELKEYSARYGSNYFLMCDTTLNTFYEQIERICELLVQERIDIRWEAFIKIHNLDERLLSKMKQAGCFFVRLGVESGSDRILQSMKKGFTVRQASNILKTCYELGINTRVYFIVGYPHETRDDIDCTIKFIKENKNYMQSLCIIKFHLDNGSLIHINPKEFGLENLRRHSNWFIFDEINGLTYKDKQKQQTKALLQILKAIYKDVLFKRYRIGFILFHLYLWYEEINNFWFKVLSNFLFQKIFYLLYFLKPRYSGEGLEGKYGIYTMEGGFFITQNPKKCNFPTK